ncbi:MAG TPA: hypothetical protein VK421_18060 [Pyrinomonadaceae bacterium]|nr:hypothetical protein [Pyrinomonadaceae bacterium]
MNSITTDLRSAAVISFALVLPLLILEALNNTITRQNAPGLALLFGVMWVLPALFVAVLLPLVRNVRAGQSVVANPVSLSLRIAFLALVAVVWTWALADQLPCFLGVPNCD